MDIHRPKSLESWREFAKEVGVIVLGVCIALAGEQTVEWLHWRYEIAEARHALDQEVAANLGAIEKRRQEGPASTVASWRSAPCWAAPRAAD